MLGAINRRSTSRGRRIPGRIPTLGSLAALAALTLASPLRAQDDITAFRVTDFGGALFIRYKLDGWSNDYAVGESFVRLPSWEEELQLRARGYVYHPAFLDWTIGGGPLLVQYRYESSAGNSSGRETLFNFDTELNFLQQRGYPFTLYFFRDHPEITTGYSGRFLAETNEYGIRGQLRPPTTPVSMHWELANWDSKGSGLGTTLNETVRRAVFRATLPYGDGHNLRLKTDWNDRTSRSGSPGLPIQESNIDTLTGQLNADNTFGDSGNIVVRQTLYWMDQETRIQETTNLESLSYNGNLNWRHTQATRSFANLSFSDYDRTETWTRNSGVNAGTVHDFDGGLTVSGSGHYTRDQAPGFDRSEAGLAATANYRRTVSLGSLGGSVRLGIDRIDQVSSEDQVSIIDEAIVLFGTLPVALSNNFVVTGSVIVTNEPKTQTFTEDIDYRLVTVGDTTTIERLITGAIEDGQTVLVSYDVLTGGTVSYDLISQGLSLNLGLFRYSNLFLNLSDTRHDVISGVATTPLNDVRRYELGGRIDYPFDFGWTIGGEYRYTRQDEDISPYTRSSYDIYTQSARYWNTTFRLGLHRETVDNEKSPEDVDLFRYRVDITSRLPGGLVIAYNADFGEDDGGTLPRKERRHSLRMDWSYRQVRFRLRASKADISQGDNDRDDKRVTAEIRRVF